MSTGGAPEKPGTAVPGSKVTVTVADDRLGDEESLAEELRAAGMHVDQVLGGVGIITGSVAPDQRGSLGSIAGVAAVEEETTFQLPPPDAEIQ